MKKADAVIIDDEKKNVKLLEHFLKTYCPQVNIIGTAFTKADSIKLIDEKKPQLVFLDIVLDTDTGFDVLDEISHEEFKVIFVTSHSEYAIRAFKYNAIDYVLKPISTEDLVIAVNKAYDDIENELFTTPDQLSHLSSSIEKSTSLDFIALPSVDKIEFIKLEQIVYLKSDGRYTIFHLADGKKVVVAKNLGEYENFMDANNFFRIHNSYIVNLRHIIKINKASGSYCEMTNRDSLPIAKRRQEALSKFLRIK